jgi:FkbM family methyltransferase
MLIVFFSRYKITVLKQCAADGKFIISKTSRNYKMRKNRRAVVYLIVLGLLAAAYGRENKEGCDCPASKFEEGSYYSQYYEDYILAYVFKNFKNGYYIDVGANDPNNANVTRYFYERGWRGINIEPNVELFKRIVQCRPRDSNYNCGISNKEGTLDFYQETEGSMGLSTFDKAIAEREKKEYGTLFKEIPVPVTALDKIAAKASLPEITFISIDVEGFEKQVLESIDLVKYKPFVLCIEATEPMTEIPSYMAWEKIVVDKKYVFAMFDGLNRFYVHKDHVDLLPRFIDIDRCVKKSKFKRKVRMNGIGLWE